jgi:hypothetical protein
MTTTMRYSIWMPKTDEEIRLIYKKTINEYFEKYPDCIMCIYPEGTEMIVECQTEDEFNEFYKILKKNNN